MEYFGENITNVYEVETLNEETMGEMQEKDETLSVIIKHLKDRTQPDFTGAKIRQYRMVFRKLFMEDGVLRKKTESGSVYVVPDKQVDKVLDYAHGTFLAGHYGISKTYFKLVKRYYFPNLITRLTEHIESCRPCIRRKMPSRKPKPALQPIPVDHLDIGGTISYDFKGPLPTSSKSVLYQCHNRFVLSIVDFATRYVLAVPTPSMEARVVAEVILSAWIPRFGVPRTVISDRAKSFTGIVMKTIYGALQVDVNITAAYNPNANGLIEQTNRNISSLLMVMLEEGVEDWPKKLPIVFSAYNATPQCYTGHSPNFLVMGREIIEPLDLFL